MSKAQISVVIPLFNKAETIERSLHSLTRQTSLPAEVLVVDDGSHDDSLNLAEQFSQAYPKLKIRLLFQPNQGVSAARNHGIRAAKHEYIAFLDADDTYEPEFIEELQSLISTHPNAAVFCTRYNFLNGTGDARLANWHSVGSKSETGIFKRYFHMVSKGDLPISSSSVCVTKTALKRAGGFPHGQQMGEDQWLWSILALNESIAYSTRPLANYFSDTEGSLMATKIPSQELPYSAMLQDLLDTSRFSKRLTRDVEAMIRTHLFDLVRRNFAAMHMAACKALLADSRLDRWRLRSLYWRAKLTLFSIATNRCARISELSQ